MALPLPASLRVCVAENGQLPANQTAAFGGETAANFSFYINYSSSETELFWTLVYAGEQLVGVVPVVRLAARKATDMLQAPLRQWLGPVIGPLFRRSTLLVDTAFMAYDDCSPFLCQAGVNRKCIKLAVSSFLKAYHKVDAVWISEPPEEAIWAASDGYVQFHMLPMVHVELSGCASLEDYARKLSRKRRQNFRHQRNVFATAGGKIEIHRGPFGENHRLLEQLLGCLRASAANSQFTVPYNDVLINPKAFAAQRQTVLVALANDEVVGFMSFLQDGTRLMQCHGGLDYEKSHEILAYHNLIYAGIEHAIERGCHMMSMGPLNNETKRRAGCILKPIVASIWNRNPLDALLLRSLFARNFEVYRGEFNAGSNNQRKQ